jgi:hypothetical protein
VIGVIEGTHLCFDLLAKRFYANLSIRVLPSKRQLSLLSPQDIDAFEGVMQYARDSAAQRGDSHETVARHNAFMSAWIVENPAAVRVTSVFAALGWPELDQPLKSELNYVRERFRQTPGVAGLVAKIREQSRLVKSAVNRKEFEIAAHHRDLREAAFDRLYDACLTGV